MPEAPAVSLVIPLRNEAENVRLLASTLASALDGTGLSWELLLVDNGSSDATGSLIEEIASAEPRVRKVAVAVNEGYGNGILAGLRVASGTHVGYMCGDLQVDAADVAGILSRAVAGDADLVKATRVKREDGPKRRFFSRALNVLVRLLFSTKGRDVNGTPKVMTRGLYQSLGLESRRWFIDAEVMIKAGATPGVRVVEVPVAFHRRREGRSSVRCLSASLEILGEMLQYRFRRLSTFRGTQAVGAEASRVLPG